jgi:hypothetical protein
MLTLPKKLVIVLAALLGVELLAMGVAYGLVLAPQKQRVAELDEQLVAKEKEYAQAQADAEDSTQQRLDEEYVALQGSLARFAIRPEELTDLLARIDELADEAGLTDFTRRTKAAPPTTQLQGGSISQTWIDVTFTSSFNELATFVSLLESNQPVVFVQRYKLARARSGDDHLVSMVLAVLVRDAAPEVVAAPEE